MFANKVTKKPGWWFQTFFIFHNIWDNPSHGLIFFKMVKTTNQKLIFVFLDLEKKPLTKLATTRCPSPLKD